MKIMTEMQVKLTVEELGRLSAIKTKNIKAYEKYLMRYEHMQRRTEGDTQQAGKLAQESIYLDPEYGAPYILLAKTYLDDVWYYKTISAAESLATADRLVQHLSCCPAKIHFLINPSEFGFSGRHIFCRDL